MCGNVSSLDRNVPFLAMEITLTLTSLLVEFQNFRAAGRAESHTIRQRGNTGAFNLRFHPFCLILEPFDDLT